MSANIVKFKQKHKGFKVITVLSRKGGTGKSSTVANLAQAFRICVKNVLIVDADDQRSIMDWEEIAEANNRMEKYGDFFPEVVAADNPTAINQLFDTLDNDIAYKDSCEYVFIDMAGHMNQIREGGLTSELFDAVIKQSDVLIMVNTPDMFSVRSNKEGCALINERLEVLGETDNVILRSLINNVPTRMDSGTRKSIQEYHELVEEGLFWPFFETQIGYSRRVAASLSEGSTAFIPVKEKCAEWYDSLMREIMDLMGENPKTVKSLKNLKKDINAIVSSENLISAKPKQ